MNAEEFKNLYIPLDSNETVIPFKKEVGFSLIRPYPTDTHYYRDGKRMFIKIAILDSGLFYEVHMTRPEKRGETIDYVIIDGEEYKKKVTNFISMGGESEFVFDDASQKVVHRKTRKDFSLNQFVEILVENHLADQLFWKRKLNASAVNALLKILFWLSDKHYERVRVSIDRYKFKQGNKSELREKIKNIDPFFNYFYISKNLFFSILLITFIIAVVLFSNKVPLKYSMYSLFGEFSLSNPLVVISFFLGLFLSEILSKWLDKNIKEFLEPEEDIFHDERKTFIEKLHDYQHSNKFDLKLKIRNK